MLKWRHRLRRRRDIQQVHRQGKTKRSQHLTLKTLKKTSDSPPQLAIIVSSKTAKSAVVRNRIRRRLRGALSELIDQLPPGVHLLIVVNSPQLSEIPYHQLKAELVGCLRAAGALN